MYARVTTCEFQLDKIEEAVEVWRKALPPYKGEKGFHHAFLLVDPDTAKGIALTLWDSQEDSRQHVESGGMMQALSQFFDLMKQLPEVEGFEVMAQL